MNNAIIQALRRARQAYMTNVGEPTAQLVGGGVRGYLGLDAPDYADGRGMEAYRNAQAIANTPVVGVPAMAARAGTRAAPAVAKALREHSKGFQEYNRALGPAGVSQATVWHGSPHKFDAFDSSKIGTGEGTQVYGHGLYLAENPAVAAEYQNTLRDIGFSYDGQKIDRLKNPVMETAAKLLHESKGDKAAAKVAADRYAYDELLKAQIEKMNPSLVSVGNLYKVDLPDEKIARMLDWDKPLSQQSEPVRALLPKLNDWQRKMLEDQRYHSAWKNEYGPGNTGGAKYGELMRSLGGSDKAAQFLREQGVPGIRYFDQGSRGSGKGTSNFVVFPGEEAALTILERNNEIINALRKKKQQ